jgi:hypothetical protein
MLKKKKKLLPYALQIPLDFTIIFYYKSILNIYIFYWSIWLYFLNSFDRMFEISYVHVWNAKCLIVFLHFEMCHICVNMFLSNVKLSFSQMICIR